MEPHADVPSGPLLVVSPHLDDAIFSCAALLERAEPIDVLTVFSGEPDPPQQGWWDARCGFSNSSESMRARRLENEAAFSGLPHRPAYMDLLELQHFEGPRRAEDGSAIREAIRAWTAASGPGTIALPAGAGCRPGRLRDLLGRVRRRPCEPPQHPDHIYVRDAALDALTALDTARALLYEEIPYLWGVPADGEARRVASSRASALAPLDLRVDRTEKARLVAAYASQIPHISPSHGRLDKPETLPHVERYWLLVSGDLAGTSSA
jgi:LmbE family N-acetylglucosaminyl deacetylase